MDLKLQKRNHASLRKLTKVDENNNVIEGQDELYVRVEDVPSNLLNNDATPLSEEVFEKINWKDNNALLFTQTDTLPEPISGVTQIVSLNSGQVWCVPGSNVAAFKLGTDDLALYLKKINQTYEDIKLLGSNAKIGALPADYNNTGNAAASTYLEINDGNFSFKMNENTPCVLSDKKVSFSSGNAIIDINENSNISIKNSNFLFGDNSEKLNCYTYLDNAVYGNNAIYLEFYPSLVRFKKASGGDLLTIKSNGDIYANGSNRIIDTSNLNTYIEAYFDAYFKNKFIEYYVKTAPKEQLFEGSTTIYYLSCDANSDIYQVYFSEESNGTIMSIEFYGTDVSSLQRVYKSTTGYYYKIEYILDEESGSNYLQVVSSNAEETRNVVVYIRRIYKY